MADEFLQVLEPYGFRSFPPLTQRARRPVRTMAAAKMDMSLDECAAPVTLSHLILAADMRWCARAV